MTDLDSKCRVAVVGAGTLGVTAAHAALAVGSPVSLLVRDHWGDGSVLVNTLDALSRSLVREIQRGALAPERAAVLLDRLHVTTDIRDLADAAVVIEAVPEDLATKRAVIEQIEAQVSPSCVIASSTSSLPAGWLAAGARYPERILVTHYVWPAHRMPLVEVALHHDTSEAAWRTVAALLAAQRKTVIRVADRPGFLITRALLAYWNEAVSLVAEGFDAADVDAALEQFGFPLGPLRMMDAAGLATAYAVHGRVTVAVGRRHLALDRLQAVLDHGLTGFYDREGLRRWSSPRAATVLRGGEPRPCWAAEGAITSEIVDRIVEALAQEVDRAVRDGVVADWPEAGRAIDLAYGFPHSRGGLHHWWSTRPMAGGDRVLISANEAG